MKIYLKGYYGYQNFGDELLLFGVIGEIFSHYEVEELVIEVGNQHRMQTWIQKNRDFIDQYYHQANIEADWTKISFFEPQSFFEKKKKSRFPRKRNQYFQTFLGNHPYRKYFKIFGGGEVIDESRSFPHNGRNLFFLYARSIFSGKFALWGGLGSQESFWIRLLTSIIVFFAQEIVLRDHNSYTLALSKFPQKKQKIGLRKDFSFEILEFFARTHQSLEKKEYSLLNLSPAFASNYQATLNSYVKQRPLYYFPCDLNYDLILAPQQGEQLFLWTEHSLEATLTLFTQAQSGAGSRLHFLYCCQQLNTSFIPLSSSKKILTNLGEQP